MRFLHALLGLACLGVVLVGLAGFFLVAGCSTSPPEDIPQIVLPNPIHDYVHEPSGFRFPLTVMTFTRGDMKLHDHEGQRVSVGYNLTQINAMMVSVDPVSSDSPDDTLESHFRKCTEDFLAQHPGAKLISEEPERLKIGHQERDAQHAVFSYHGVHLRQQKEMRAEIYLVKNGNWYVRYDCSCPAVDRETGSRYFKIFVGEFSWPEEKSNNNKEKSEKVENSKAASKDQNKPVFPGSRR